MRTFLLDEGWAVNVDPDRGGPESIAVYRPDGEYYSTRYSTDDFGPELIDVRGRPAILLGVVTTIKHRGRTLRVEWVSFWFIGSARRISFLFSDLTA